MSIVKEALNKLKGSISVISELGNGTTFNVVVPNLFRQAESQIEDSL